MNGRPNLIGAGRRPGEEELIRPVTADDGAARHLLVERAGDGSQHGVAGLVARRRVEEIEAVDVQQGDHQPAALSSGLRHQCAELLDDHPMIRKAGETVTSRALQERVCLADKQ